MRRVAILCLSMAFVSALLVASGCEGSSGGGNGGSDAVTGGDTDGGGGGGGGGSDTGGGSAASCEQPAVQSPAPHVWADFAYEGTTYTLNSCPDGIPALEGSWAFYYPEQDATHALGDNYKELFTFSGNTWHARMYDLQNGAVEEGFAEGWFFCSQKPENDKEVKVFITTNVVPDGVFGNTVGSVFSADILGIDSTGMNDFYMYYYDGVATSATHNKYLDAFYCKVGEDINGSCCANPFAE